MREYRICRDDSGFSMVELMTVILIIAILLLIALASSIPATRSAASSACRHNQQVLNRAVAAAEAGSDGSSVDDLDDLRPWVSNFDSIILCPLDHTPLAFDPFTQTVSCPNHP